MVISLAETSSDGYFSPIMFAVQVQDRVGGKLYSAK